MGGDFLPPNTIHVNRLMIQNPHVFVIYEPGMFGTLICNLFMHHKLWQGTKPAKKQNPDDGDLTAHHGYVDCLKNFHGYNDSIQLSHKTLHELEDFFKTIENVIFGVHRLSSYYFTKIKLEEHFKNFVRIIIKPDLNQIDRFGERMDDVLHIDYHNQWWMKNVAKKDLSKIPPWFIKKMSVKEKIKYLQRHVNFLETNYTVNPKTDIVFNPSDITNPTLLQHMIDDTCSLLDIDKFTLPVKEIENHVNLNRNYL